MWNHLAGVLTAWKYKATVERGWKIRDARTKDEELLEFYRVHNLSLLCFI